MSLEFIVFIAMVGVFTAVCFALRWPVAVGLLLASVAGALVGGQGIPIRHLVEGTFAYVDTILTIATAMLFMAGVRASGALEALSAGVIRRFIRFPSLLLILLTFVAMFPGMITGSSSAAVLSAGAVVAPMFMLLGLPKEAAAALIAMAGILGMTAPPVNIPAMIIGGGIDMPFVGFEIPLLLLTIPLAIFSALWLGYPYARRIDRERVLSLVASSESGSPGLILFSPIILVIALMVLDKVLPTVFSLGMPLIFTIGAVATIPVGRKFNIVKTAKEAINQALPVLGILVGVGMFIQIMTLTGVRGFIVVNALSVPAMLLYVAIVVSLPLFGAVSAFGAASILGVPFLLALLDKDQIITASALSLISALGDFMPPTALSAIFAAQVVGLDNYRGTLKKLLVPSLLVIVWALVFIIFSKQIRIFL